jgi:hypothetical protein
MAVSESNWKDKNRYPLPEAGDISPRPKMVRSNEREGYMKQKPNTPKKQTT